MRVCVRLFCVCVVMCVGSGLATGWYPVQGVLPCIGLWNRKKCGHGLTKVCRTIDVCCMKPFNYRLKNIVNGQIILPNFSVLNSRTKTLNHNSISLVYFRMVALFRVECYEQEKKVGRERSRPNLRYYSEILLERLRNTRKFFRHGSLPPGWDINPGLPNTKQDSGVIYVMRVDWGIMYL
jgi:hypothetical protein